MTITEKLRSKAEELQLERRMAELVAETEKAVSAAIEKAGSLAHEHRDDIDGWVDKATATFDEKTSGKYAAPVSRLREGVRRGVSRLADQRPPRDAG